MYQAQTWGELATSWAWNTSCRWVEAVVEVQAEEELDHEGFARPRSLFPDVRIVHRGVTILSFISCNSLLAGCLPPVSTGSDSS